MMGKPKPEKINTNSVQKINLQPSQYGPKFEQIEVMLNKMNTAANQGDLPAVREINGKLKHAIKNTETELQNHSSKEELSKCAADFQKKYANYCPKQTSDGGAKKISKKNQQSQKKKNKTNLHQRKRN